MQVTEIGDVNGKDWVQIVESNARIRKEPNVLRSGVELRDWEGNNLPMNERERE